MIELEKISDPEFEKYIADAPRAFGRLVAKYYNEPLLHTTTARLKAPNPQLDSDDDEFMIDDTKYLNSNNDGKLRPGCLLKYRESLVNGTLIDQCISNVDILITEERIIRFICAYHIWDGVVVKIAYYGSILVGSVENCLEDKTGLINLVSADFKRVLGSSISHKATRQNK